MISKEEFDKMVDELTRNKVKEYAEAVAEGLAQNLIKGMMNAESKNAEEIKEQIPLIPPTAPVKAKAKVSRNHGKQRRYPYNPHIVINPKPKTIPGLDTQLFRIYDTARELLSAGPAPRGIVTRTIEDQLGVDRYSVSKCMTTLMDKGLIVVSQENVQ